MTKIILITASNLGPYHHARYQYLASTGVELIVVKTPVAEFHRPWKTVDLNLIFRIIAPYTYGQSITETWQITKKLINDEQPDVIVCVGYNRRYVWIWSLIANLHSIPCLLYLVGWAGERQRTNWKELIKRIYCRMGFTGALVTGARATEYAHWLGIPKENIQCISNVVDNEHFANLRHSDLLSIDLPENYFFTSARLNQDKNLDGLLQAFASYRDAGGSWSICIAGTGPDQERLRNNVPPQVAPYVHWLGWVSYENLPAIYQQSRCFILPSFIEPWGLVVNEAMAAGCPVLVSMQCGCVPELVDEGCNGFSFSPKDTKYLAELMLKMQKIPMPDLLEMGKSSRKIISEHTLDSWAQAFEKGIHSTCKLQARKH